MGRCSYTWVEQDKEKKEYVKKYCQKETWKGSDEFCIFHDPSPEKDVDLFKEMLEKQIQSETIRHNFIGYHFPREWNFSSKKFRIDAHFERATFQGYADFREAGFLDAHFEGTAFQGYAHFGGATFHDAHFERATFQRKVELAPKNNTKINLRYSEFLFRGLVSTNLAKCLFHRSIIENVAFIDCIWPKKYIIYEEEHKNDKEIDLSFSQLETIYRDLKQNMQNHGDYIRAGEFYYREMEMRRKGTPKKEISRWWLEFYRRLAGYGEKPARTLLSSFFIIVVFAFLYWFLECLQYPEDMYTVSEKLVGSVYFSFVTFTTLGLGDIHPINNLGRSLVCCEAVIGAFLIALFVVVFARKMMR